eukprot:CAMPEP_0168431108 /NCGR_PEP_ID=MMETSP0228-20121227/38214_1 /TAXON_ID=133427 /ORGANISM="Protoceratium reticulatum, Strain CCCM 535 (=CCMP 1889)" /LENGTH=75 /DNA_ID=CAMNT_0008445211 /DNA_START=25 /DNA_END=251 /DNA_ORIENTATION=+
MAGPEWSSTLPERARRRDDEDRGEQAAPQAPPHPDRALRKSRCNEAFLKRVKENDEKKRDAKLLGKTISCKRQPE